MKPKILKGSRSRSWIAGHDFYNIQSLYGIRSVIKCYYSRSSSWNNYQLWSESWSAGMTMPEESWK